MQLQSSLAQCKECSQSSCSAPCTGTYNKSLFSRRFFAGDVLEYPTGGKQANVFWDHIATGHLDQAAHWGNSPPRGNRHVSEVPGVLQVWETEREHWLALFKESQDNSENYKQSGLTGRLGALALFHKELLGNADGQAMLRPLGVELLQKSLKSLEVLTRRAAPGRVGRGGPLLGLPASSF